jgi:hypothetical protein
MVDGIRLFLAIFIILFFTPQTPKMNPLIRQLDYSSVFRSYVQAYWFVVIMTRGAMVLFLLITLYSGVFVQA